ncbi:hypothetical protein BP6252_00242 [Coleophoma cylindrospora]|uniref:Copper homeostasis protein cutC homolog n=1 Tax=Coleophoma cylindrospora TaxID=1849047 RepID=A0A3D8SPG4_9HELO|nr:hypothetical protein BP6252_00242 [Coleophoma cylindrospora]
MPFLEIACFTPASVLLAASAGADRIEFCADASVGGITPALADFQQLRPQISIPMYVMIRPRGGAFVYAEPELAQMARDLVAFREAGADGFVLGILDRDGGVDVAACTSLVRLAGGKSCTFHRAFDEVEEEKMPAAVRDVAACGFGSILTSGGKATAAAGEDVLRRLVVEGRDQGMQVIVGGGVRSTVLEDLQNHTNAVWFHSSAVTDGGLVADEKEVKALKAILG